MKIALGLIAANGFPVPAPFVIGYSHLLQALIGGVYNDKLPADRKITKMRALWSQDFPIDWARNRCCQLFLDEDDADYLLFLDTDMVHPPDLAHRLVWRDKDIVSAHYVTRRPPFFTVAMEKVGDGPTDYQAVDKLHDTVAGLMPVDAAGAGALLISRPVLQAIRAKCGDDWFRYQDGPDGKRSRSEDMWFFERAKDCGYQAWLDADVKCQHIAQIAVDWRNHEPYREAHERALAEVKA